MWGFAGSKKGEVEGGRISGLKEKGVKRDEDEEKYKDVLVILTLSRQVKGIFVLSCQSLMSWLH
jgi:hypothetical protein